MADISASRITSGVLDPARIPSGVGGGGSVTLTGDVTGSGSGSFATTLATAQPGAHTWAATQTFTLAPVFTDAGGTRTALGLGTLATQSGTFSGTHSGTSSGTNTGDQTTVSGNAGSATVLQTARNINGVSFNGSADITVTAAAGTLTGTTLNSTVVTSSLTSVGTIVTGVWNGTTIAVANGGTGGTTAAAARTNLGLDAAVAAARIFAAMGFR